MTASTVKPTQQKTPANALGNSDRHNRQSTSKGAGGSTEKSRSKGRSKGRNTAAGGSAAALEEKERELEKQRKVNAKLLKKLKENKKSKQAGEAKEKKWPRPDGEASKDFNLQEAMGLKNDKLRYLACRRAVRTAMDNAKLGLEYMYHQPHVRTTQAKVEARTRMPYLGKFENDWATHEIMLTALGNRRKKDKAVKEELGEGWEQELDVGELADGVMNDGSGGEEQEDDASDGESNISETSEGGGSGHDE